MTFDYPLQGGAGEGYGLHSEFDLLPTNVPNGTAFFELDTSNLYMFDAINKVWRLV